MINGTRNSSFFHARKELIEIEKDYKFSSAFNNTTIWSINFSGILDGTQKTLNLVNQTIPLVQRVTPIMKKLFHGLLYSEFAISHWLFL